MTKARTSWDMGALAKALQRPGIDPRQWATLAVVQETGFDPEEGAFADVTFLPSNQVETCYIGSDYTGDGFGEWNPLHVGDLVLVIVPEGDAAAGPVIVKRIWTRTEKPPADFAGTNDEPTNDRVLIVQPGQKYRVVVSAGGQITVENTTAKIQVNSADILIEAATVNAGDDQAVPLAIASSVSAVMSALTAMGTSFTTLTTPLTPLNAIGTTLNASIAAIAQVATVKLRGT